MGIQQNMANAIRMIQKMRHKSMDEFAEDLQISRSTLHEYCKGRGNPTALMMEHLAQKMDIDPSVLVSGLFDPNQQEAAMLLLSTIQEISKLPKDRRVRFAELFLEMVSLWDGDT